MQFIDLAAQQARLRAPIEAAIARVLAHGQYVMGPEVRELEQKLAAFCGARHALACANGTDALMLGLMALGLKPGAAVICPAFTFAATAEAPAFFGAKPLFADIDPATFNLDVESARRALRAARDDGLDVAGVISVDLFGLPADYDAIERFCEEEGLWLLADAAQSFGATWKGRRAGAIGRIAATSFYPAKPLGCYGDGGAVFTGADDLAALIESLRVHGKGENQYDIVRVGMNSRLDTLQAAILLAKLDAYEAEIVARDAAAARYADALADLAGVAAPVVPDGARSVWAQYTVRFETHDLRERARETLKAAGVPSVVYYPSPLHVQRAYADAPRDPEGLPAAEAACRTALSLPMHADLSPEDQDRVLDALRTAVSG